MSHSRLHLVQQLTSTTRPGARGVGTFQPGGSAMVNQSAMLSSESRILELVHLRKSLTLEQVVNLLPELSWNQVFKTIDELSRHGKIILLRRGFDYEIERVASRQPALACIG